MPILRPKLGNRWTWFWGSTKKPVLLVSLCTVQTAHSITRLPDHPAIEYPTCAWSSPIICTRSPTPTYILIAARYVAPATYTPWDKQTWFSIQTKIKVKTTEMTQIEIQTSACQWLITYQTKVLITWFLRIEISFWCIKGVLKMKKGFYKENRPWADFPKSSPS
jgi:hypothetical protein